MDGFSKGGIKPRVDCIIYGVQSKFLPLPISHPFQMHLILPIGLAMFFNSEIRNGHKYLV